MSIYVYIIQWHLYYKTTHLIESLQIVAKIYGLIREGGLC